MKNLTGATVNWSLTSHWGDFNEVRGRITSDSAQRGLDASEEPNPTSFKTKSCS